MKQEMSFPNTITRASAGSGKTFALSNRYLGLVHHGVPPERILATTFARKAAGEILDRILIRLAEAADDHAKRDPLAAVLGETTLSQSSCRSMLRSLAGNLHRLRVGTIDSFFAQVVRSFALELGVPPRWQIIDSFENDRLRDQAIEAVLAEHNPADLFNLVNLLTKGEAQRRISGLLRDAVTDLYAVYLDASPDAWETLPRPRPLADDAFLAAMEDLRTLEVSRPAQQTARDDDYQRAMHANWKAFLTTGIAKCVFNRQETYRSQEITPEMVAVYSPLIDHAKAMLLNRAANVTRGAHTFLSRFDEHYRRLKHQRRAMLFDDVTRAVARLAADEDAETLAFRLDSQIDHLLLDEFQDTSPAQWSALEPLGRRVTAGLDDRAGARGPMNAASSESCPTPSFFCVGDVKQAIYGWRGGVAEIFATVEARLGTMNHQALDKSYRSAPVIIETVNTVFSNLTRHPKLKYELPAIAAFEQNFPRHETAKEGLPGYACLVTGPPTKDDEPDPIYEFAARYIDNLARQTPGHSIGVLCRKNDVVSRLIYELRHRGIHASEEGGNPLTDSAAVLLVLALLKLADHPGDTIARHHLASSPWAAAWNIQGRGDSQAALRISRQVRRRLLEEGYGPTMLDWTRSLAPHCNPRELSRLKQLVELAYAYQPGATLRTTDFLQLVQLQRVADPTAHPVRVTTIHRAKGLEFDIVVLPDLETIIFGQPGRFVVHRSDGGTGPIDGVFEYFPQDLQPLLPLSCRQMIEESTFREVTESMCVLYVALTRAVHALHMVISPSKPHERSCPRKISGLLRCALLHDKPVPAGATIWEQGDSRWFASVGSASRATAPSDCGPVSTEGTAAVPALPPLEVRIAPPQAGASRSLERVAPSRLHVTTTARLADIFAEAETTFAKDRGSQIHACFEQIEWLDDGPPDRPVLQRVLARYATDSAPADQAIDEFYQMLRRGEVAALLRRSHYEPPPPRLLSSTVRNRLRQQPLTVRVRREHGFALTDENHCLVQGSIDRLVMLYDGDQLVAADIIDFKTDADTEPSHAAARHRAQLLAYREAVARHFNLPAECIAARLVMLTDGSTIDIAAGTQDHKP